MSFKFQPPFSYRMERSDPCYLPVPLFPVQTPYPMSIPWTLPRSGSIFQRCRRRSSCSGLDRSRALHSEHCRNQPWSGGGGSSKDEHPETLSKALVFFLLLWCKSTACASAGLTPAVEKPWSLAGIRWLVLNTFTGAGQLKEQNQRAKQTSHCQIPVQRTWV